MVSIPDIKYNFFLPGPSNPSLEMGFIQLKTEPDNHKKNITIGSLQIRLYLSNPFLLAFIVLLGFWGVLEFLVNQQPVRQALPPPSIGMETMGGEIDLKIALLEDFSKKNKVDCIFVGDSMVDFGIDPQSFQNALNKKTGKNYHCFNFGLMFMMADTSTLLSKVLYERYSPELILFGTSAVDYQENVYQLRDVAKIPWIRYNLGEPSLEGWIIEHFMISRYLMMLPKLKLDTFSMPFGDYLKIQGNGFLPTYKVNKSLEKVNPEGMFDDINPDSDSVKSYNFYRVDLEGFSRLKKIQEKGGHIVTFEMPFFPSLYYQYVAGGIEKYNEQYLFPIQSYLHSSGLEYIQTYPGFEHTFPRNGWRDSLHMNAYGASFFSELLGNKIADVISR